MPSVGEPEAVKDGEASHMKRMWISEQLDRLTEKQHSGGRTPVLFPNRICESNSLNPVFPDFRCYIPQ